MRRFTHFNAFTVEEAASILKRYGSRARVIAGGTDLLGKMKDEILPAYPEAIVNLKTIPGLDFIEEKERLLKIGALTRLADVANDDKIKGRYTALAESTRRVASPSIREMGTLGGNLCQDIRCWFYRSPNNRFPCLRKGGGRCYAIEGENRYHSIFGGSVEQGCYAVHPSDVAPALIAMKGSVVTSKRTIDAEEFFQVGVTRTTVLDDDEIVTEIHVPAPPENTRSAFIKFALRKSIDFPIVNCAVMVTLSEQKVCAARICLNAVFVRPYRARKAEETLIGEPLHEASADAAGRAAVSEAKPLRHNLYMVQIAKTLVKRAILACQ